MDCSKILQNVREDPRARQHVVPRNVFFIHESNGDDEAEEELGDLEVDEPIDRDVGLDDDGLHQLGPLDAREDRDE